jgi:hypothetical protein
VLGLRYTVGPVYKRAVLEEQASRLELTIGQRETAVYQLEQQMAAMKTTVEQTTKRTDLLAKDLADALLDDPVARRDVGLRLISRTLYACFSEHTTYRAPIECLDTRLRSAFDSSGALGKQVARLVSVEDLAKLSATIEPFIASVHATELIDDSKVRAVREDCQVTISAAEGAASEAKARNRPPEVVGAIMAQLAAIRAGCTIPTSIGEMENVYRKQHFMLVPRYLTLWEASSKAALTNTR